MPTLFIIAGPNGAGKTTAAKFVLPKLLGMSVFVNADEIAAQLSPDEPEKAALQAGRIMLNQIEDLLNSLTDFTVETTLATRSYVGLVERAQARGYYVQLLFFYVSSADVSVQRVAERVKLGGHNIPEETIRRRYILGMQNFVYLFKDKVDSWDLYDNESLTPKFVAKSVNGLTHIENYEIWSIVNSY